MAIDTLTFAEARTRPWFAEAAFLAFLLLAFVGFAPFAPPPPAALAGQVIQTGAGDAARQLGYLAVFGAIVLCALRRQGWKALEALPVLLLVLLVWCAASALWSSAPDVTFRRSVLAFVLVVSAFLSVETVGNEKALSLWRWMLLAVLVVNLASIKLVGTAVHLPGESDPQLVGDWRGLYSHKNIAGSVGALTALMFLFSPARKTSHKLFDIAVACAAIAFTVMTRSKSSLGLLAIALVAAAAYRIAWRREIDRIIAVVAAVLVAAVGATFLIANLDAIAHLLGDPQQFTGRTEIWRAEIAYILDHPLFGAGFGTFSNTGGVTPLQGYVGSWVAEAGNGHNGYLQILVTTGCIGFTLAMAALLAAPALAFWRRGDVAMKATLFGVFVFLVLHNLMETDFLEGDGVAWVAFLVMLAMLNKRGRETS